MGGKHDTETINSVMNSEVAAKEPIVEKSKIQELLNIDENIPYIQCDPFVGNPFSLLGRVVEVRKVNGKIPKSINTSNIEFSPLPIPGIVKELDSILKNPVLRQSVIINNNLSANIGMFNYLNAELDSESVFSINVIDQSAALVDVQDPSWAAGLKSWKNENSDLFIDDDICYLYVIVGFIQKQIIRKKFKKFDVKATGGAFGININGKLHTSTDEYSMDIRYGLTPAILKRPKTELASIPKSISGIGVSLEEKRLFATAQTVIFKL